MAGPAATFRSDPSPEALAFWRNKTARPSFDYRDVWAEEHAHAFTVAKAVQPELLETIRKAVDDALAKGIPYEQFAAELEPKLKAAGWWGRTDVTDPETGETFKAELGSPRRMRLIYDANIRSANAAGQWERAWRTRAALPYFLYIETTSRVPRDEHLAQVGTIAAIDDPFWDTWFPPNGWNCKCGVRQITLAEALKRGWKPGSKPPEVPTKPWINQRTGDVEEIPVGIDPGWHRNPARFRQAIVSELLGGNLDNVDPALRAAALKDIGESWLVKKIASGDFFDFAKAAKTPDIAAPIGHLGSELEHAHKVKSGVVWLTPEKPFVLGKPPIAEWALVPRMLDEGAAISDPANPAWLTFYRKIDGQYWKAEVAPRDLSPTGEKLKGGKRLNLERFERADEKIVKLELNLAKQEGRLLREEAKPGFDLYDLPPASLGAAAAPKKPRKKAATAQETVPQHLANVMKEVEAVGWQGKALPLDKDLIEDHNVLAFTVRRGKKTFTVFQGRLREEADHIVTSKLVGISGAKPRGAGPLKSEDTFFSDFLYAVRAINRSLDQKKPVSSYAVEQLRGRKKALKTAASSKDEAVSAMAAYYLDWLEKIERATASNARVGQFAQFQWTPKPVKATASKEMAVTRAESLRDEKRTLKGRILEGGSASTNRGHGVQFDVAFPDKATAFYRPWDNDNAYAHRGVFEIAIEGTPSDAVLASAIEKLKVLGIDAAAASPADLELAYLRRQAAASGLTTDPHYKALLADMRRKKVSIEDEVATLVAYWEKRLGVADLRTSGRWNPDGDYQPAIAGSGKAGRRVHYRFDVTPDDIAREMPEYRVFHQNTGGMSMYQLVDRVADNGGVFMAQTERMRVGVDVRGMSVDADMATGGGAYFFTRIRQIKRPTDVQPGFYWKPNVLRRLDAVTYDRDLYGRMTGSTREDHHRVGIGGWKTAAAGYGNETVFKGTLSIREDMDFIVVKTDGDRQYIVESLKRAGINELGGAPVEERVFTGSSGFKHPELEAVWTKDAALPSGPSPLGTTATSKTPMPIQTLKNGKPKVPSLAAIKKHWGLSDWQAKKRIDKLTYLLGSKKKAQFLLSQINEQEYETINWHKNASGIVEKLKLQSLLAKL